MIENVRQILISYNSLSLEEKREFLEAVTRKAVVEDYKDPNLIYHICKGITITYIEEQAEDKLLFIFGKKWADKEGKSFDEDFDEFSKHFETIKNTQQCQ